MSKEILTLKQRNKFLTHLSETGNVSSACRASGVMRHKAYAFRKVNQDFALEWESAMEDHLDALEAALHQRAMNGVEKPVYYGGEKVGGVKNYNDALGMFLLRSKRGEIYGEPEKTNKKLSRAPSVDMDHVRERLYEKLNLLEADDKDEEGGGD